MFAQLNSNNSLQRRIQTINIAPLQPSYIIQFFLCLFVPIFFCCLSLKKKFFLLKNFVFNDNIPNGPLVYALEPHEE